MNEQPYRSLIDLVAFDQELERLYTLVEHHKIQKQELYHKQQMLQQELDQAKERLHGARKEVDIHELTMKELEEQLQEKKKRLDTVSNNKEYQSINTEINKIKQQQHDLEQVLVDVWHRLEAAQRTYDAQTKGQEEQMKTVAASQEEVIKKIDQLHQEMSVKEKERVEKEKLVPQELLEKYAMMRSRVSDPVVPVIDRSCTGCFYLMTDHDMQELHKNKLLQCRGCYRFVYLPQDAQKTQTDKLPEPEK